MAIWWQSCWKGTNPNAWVSWKGPQGTSCPGRNKVKFKNHHKQMKALFMVFADLESLIRKIHGCAKKGQATINRCSRALWLFLHNREKWQTDSQPIHVPWDRCSVQDFGEPSVSRIGDESRAGYDYNASRLVYRQQRSHTCSENLVRAVPLKENSQMGWTLEVDL